MTCYTEHRTQPPATAKSLQLISGPDVPEVLANMCFLTRTLDIEENQTYFEVDELDSLPDPDDIESNGCGVCYGCVQMRKPCSQPSEEAHDAYQEWYPIIGGLLWEAQREHARQSVVLTYTFEKDCGECCDSICPKCDPSELERQEGILLELGESIEFLPEECPGCETGADFDGAHIWDGEYHPNCYAKSNLPSPRCYH